MRIYKARVYMLPQIASSPACGDRGVGLNMIKKIEAINGSDRKILRNELVYFDHWDDFNEIAVVRAFEQGQIREVIGAADKDTERGERFDVKIVGVINDIDTSKYNNGEELFCSPTEPGKVVAKDEL